jgi:hypothetical protein
MEPGRDPHTGIVTTPAACANLAEALEHACAKLLTPLDQAWAVLEAAGLGDARKRPRQVTG